MTLAATMVGVGATRSSSAGGSVPAGTVGVLPHVETLQVLADTRGRILALGAGFDPDARAFVTRLGSDGRIDRSFGKEGTARWPYLARLGWDVGAIRPDGDIVVAGTTRFGVIDEVGALHVDLLDASGRLVRSFGRDGDVALKQPACLRGPTGMSLQGDEVVLAALRWCGFHAPQSIVLLRLRADGAVDKSFGKGGVVSIGQVSPLAQPASPALSLAAGRVLIATSQQPGTLTLTEVLRDGLPAPHFGSNGTVRATVAPGKGYANPYGLFVGKARILTVTGCSVEGPYLARFNADGSPYRYWPPSSGTATNVEPLGGALVNGCGRFAVARDGDFVGAGHAVAWFRPSGLLDLRHSVDSLPSGAIAASIVASNDGSVLVSSQRGTTTYISRSR